MSQPRERQNRGMEEGRVLDVRTYRIASGRRDELVRLFREEIRPMLDRHGIDVVAAGPSLVDDDGFTLIRSFDSLEQRREQLEGFYGSAEWLERFDAVVTELIEAYHVVVVPAPPGLESRG